MKLILTKQSSLGKVEKIARKNIIKTLLFAVFVIFIIVLFLLFPIFFKTFEMNVKNIVLIIFFTLLIIALMLIILYFSIKQDYINDAYEKVRKETSKLLAEKLLPIDELVEINLISTSHCEYNDFFLKNLPNMANYYARLGKENLIAIYVKFRDKKDDNYYFLEAINKEDFSKRCEVVKED